MRAMTEKRTRDGGAATGGRTARAETSLQGHLHLPPPSAAYTLAVLSHLDLPREVTGICLRFQGFCSSETFPAGWQELAWVWVVLWNQGP